MIKKFIVMSVILFGLSAIAESSGQGRMDHMSDMMHNSGEADDSNLVGSVELKWNVKGFSDGTNYPSYRARIGWKGEINDSLKWKVGFTTHREQRFLSGEESEASITTTVEAPAGDSAEGAPARTQSERVTQHIGGHPLPWAYLEQAYVAYSPVEGFVIKAGKFGWKSKFHKTGVLYDDDVYSSGALVRYYYENDNDYFYVKGILRGNPFHGLQYPKTPKSILKGKLGGKYAFSSDIDGGAYLAVDWDGLFSGEGEGSKTTGQAGVNVGVSSMGVPVGVFATWLSDVQNLGFKSFTGGAYVGQAGTSASGQQGDFGLAASYYQVDPKDFRTYLLDTDYVTYDHDSAEAYKGVAFRAQYNLLDKVNLVAKYTHELNNSGNNNVVGELTFNF